MNERLKNTAENTNTRAYRNYFIRGEKRLSSVQAKQYETFIPVRGTNSDAVRLNNLYRDCFAIHVTDYFGASSELLSLSNQEDRIIATDNITACFLNKHYSPPSIVPTRETDDTHNRQESGLELDTFIRRVSTNPIDCCTEDSDELGTNKVTYLIGDVGIGKSTMIARIHMLCATGNIDHDGYRVVPIIYDFETRHRDGERLRPIGDEFWADLYTHVYHVLSSRKELNETADLDKVIINPKQSDSTYHPFLIRHFRQLVHHLALRKIRLFIVFDNLDRYHFRYTEYAFFSTYAEDQMTSVRDNVASLVKTFDRGDLWKCGICTLFVCRKYLYEYMVKFGDVVPKDNHFGLFEISQSSVSNVITSRFNLYKEAIDTISPSQEERNKAALGDFMEHMAGVMAVGKLTEKVKHSTPALDALALIGHNGHRSFVRFLSSLSLRYTDVDAFDRLLVDQPHLLLLLYILNNQKRYTQLQDHFPNLFLNDCLLSKDDDFSEAHHSHRHTYWLKYLMLKYVQQQQKRGEYPTPQDMIDEFSCEDGYEPHLVRYMLGSLCTTSKFSCLRIDYTGKSSIADSRLELTERAEFLLNHDRRLFHEATSVEFCFNFHYLQLVIDDLALALPRSKAESIFDVDSDYSYLYLSGLEYKRAAPNFVLKKLDAVIHFFHVLEDFYVLEKEWHPYLFSNLSKLGVAVNFHDIRKYLLETTKNLLTAMGRFNEYPKYEELDSKLRYDTSTEDLMRTLSYKELSVCR